MEIQPYSFEENTPQIDFMVFGAFGSNYPPVEFETEEEAMQFMVDDYTGNYMFLVKRTYDILYVKALTCGEKWEVVDRFKKFPWAKDIPEWMLWGEPLYDTLFKKRG